MSNVYGVFEKQQNAFSPRKRGIIVHIIVQYTPHTHTPRSPPLDCLYLYNIAQPIYFTHCVQG